jgi:signal transduction histidine kinase/ActR/RegA family two-component response regulator
MSTSFPSALNGAVDDPQLIARLHQTRERAAHELVPYSIVFGWVLVVGIVWVLHSRVPMQALWMWSGVRALIGGIRFWHSSSRLRRPVLDDDGSMSTYRLLAALDGVAWSMLGWAITPIMQLDVAVVTIGVLIAVASLGTLMLHVDQISSALFIVPILLPNALYSMTRGDELGLFCALSITGLLGALLVETRRSNLRIMELLRLRFLHEQVLQAQTEALRAQAEALARAHALTETRSRFVATMSHEMRTPLHGILGLVRLLRSREADTRALRQLELIHQSGDHLVNVVNDVLDFSAMEAGSLPLHEQPFDLTALLREVSDLAKVSASEKGLSVQWRVDPRLAAHVMGDPVRLRQVLHNLLGNAIKFTQTGGVTVRATRESDGRGVRMEVQDTGVGIAPQDLSRIFEAFHQGEGTYRRRFGGTGLGLTISRDLCRAMGGDLSCTSELNNGSTFVCTLPLAEVLPERAPVVGADVAGQQVLPPSHVLLVEDNPVNAMVAEAELLRQGMRVSVVDSGADALSWLSSHRTDLVLMDCEMPGMDGFEVTRRVRAREREQGVLPTPIVALTANGFETYIQRCIGAGMDGHLAKPFRPEDLIRVLARHLHSAPCMA